jgi:hypothetical protein
MQISHACTPKLVLLEAPTASQLVPGAHSACAQLHASLLPALLEHSVMSAQTLHHFASLALQS